MAAAVNRGLSDLGIKLVHERERLVADLLYHLAGVQARGAHG